jgi:hypothetical protein
MPSKQADCKGKDKAAKDKKNPTDFHKSAPHPTAATQPPP